MTREQLAARIFHVSYLTGRFQLRSGQISHEYFDKYRFESDPRLLAAIAAQMVKLLPSNVQVLAGLEMGGIPIAAALSLETGLPMVLVRKKAKEYGTQKLAEGLDIQGKAVCIIEDVVTTGGQILLSAADLRAVGGKTHDVLCVIQRSPEGAPKLAAEGLQLHPLFTMDELKTHA